MAEYSLISGGLAILPKQQAKEIRIFVKKRVNKLAEVSLTGAGIAFVFTSETAATITDSGSGLAVFFAGDIIKVVGSTINDGVYEVASVVAGTITLHRTETLSDEDAGDTVTISTVPALEEEYEGLMVAMAARQIARKFGVGNAQGIDELLVEERQNIRGRGSFSGTHYRAKARGV